MIFDSTFDFRSDSNGKDPDSHSKTLKRHHKYLWTKLLPSGELFHLEDKDTKKYLVFYGAEGSHYLTSDSIGNSFSHHRGKIASVINQIDPEQLEEFRTLNSTIGGSILFPGNKVEGRMTINGERGFNRFIADRFDLTLECIRCHYLAIDNPLRDVLNRYDQFFHLFKDFQNYVDFFQM